MATFVARLLVLLSARARLSSAAASSRSPDGAEQGAPSREILVAVNVSGRLLTVGVSTRGSTAFRVRLDAGAPMIDTPMVAPDEHDAQWESVEGPHGRGIASEAGSVMVSKDGRVTLLDSAGRVLTRSLPCASPNELVLSASGGLMYGMGAGPDTAPLLARYGNTTPAVNNQFAHGSEVRVPHYYSTDGYAALGVVRGAGDGPTLAATFKATASEVTWRNTRPGPFEIYLMPSATLELGTFAYYSLVGRPRVPPLWTFGFTASRWGWADKAYIDDTLSRFRSGGYPADAFVMDFEWFTNESDYSYKANGTSYCHDFGYNSGTLPEPAQQLAHYREKLHFRMAGIRKPRLCNSENLAFARSRGWLLPQGEPGGDPTKGGDIRYYAKHRNLNFSIPAVRDWYATNHAHYLEDGVEFWWNDEGEVDYLEFHWWNVAQVQLHEAQRPEKRFYSINRAFSPGMARFGAGLWTGDAGHTWEVLATQPGYLLNWALAGAPYVGSDIGGFSGDPPADLLTRWYQLGVFAPIMRVHSTIFAKAHFPWLWGTEAAGLMKAALELRYRLIPYHYSFAHAMYEKRRLWMQPMVVAFPGEAALANLSHQWMDGELLVAPVVDGTSQKKVVLPSGTWYPFEGGNQAKAPSLGPAQLGGVAAPEEIPVFARAGTIVPLAPVVQHTDALPGGALEVRVYAGADAAFELVEDDGETMGYEKGEVRRTKLKWDDKARRLSWTTAGASPPRAFAHLFLSVYDARGTRTTTDEVPIKEAGALSLATSRLHR